MHVYHMKYTCEPSLHHRQDVRHRNLQVSMRSTHCQQRARTGHYPQVQPAVLCLVQLFPGCSHLHKPLSKHHLLGELFLTRGPCLILNN